MVWAVHWFEHIGIILRHLLLTLHNWEHILAVCEPVFRRFVQPHFPQVRRPDMLVAMLLLRLTDVTFHQVAQDLASWQEHRYTSADIVTKDKEFEFAPQLAV